MKPQIIKSKDKNKILDKMDLLAKSYTPDWTPDFKNPDFGSALGLIFKDMYLEQAERLNRMPDKQRRDIVNLFDPIPYGPAASRGFVCFDLSEGASNGLFLEKGFQLLAEGPEAREVHFETTEPLYVSHAKLNKALVYDHETGWLSLHEKEDMGLTFPLFEVTYSENTNAPYFEIIDPKWLYARPGMKIGLKFTTSHELDLDRLCEGLTDPKKAKWTSVGSEEPISLAVECEKGLVWLILEEGTRLSGSVRCDLLDIPFFRDIEIADLSLELVMDGLRPNKLMYNEVLIEGPESKAKEGVQAFGDAFNVFDVLLIGDDDAFSKPHAKLSLNMKMAEHLIPIESSSQEPLIKWRNIMHESELREPEPRTIRIEALIWEYWNGIGWMPLEVNKEAYKVPTEGQWTINFICPEDMHKAIFGPAESTYIRARITKVQNAFAPIGHIAVPIIKHMGIYSDTGADLNKGSIRVEKITMVSNMEKTPYLKDQIGNVDIPLAKSPDEDIHKAVYISLTDPLEKGPIRFEVSPDFESSNIDQAMCKVQYYGFSSGREGWHDQPHEDETDGFITNGLVSFMAPKHMKKIKRFNTESYWIRLVPVIHQKQTFAPKSYKRTLQMRINAVPVMQMETLASEYYAVPAIQPWANIYLSRAPILSGQVWVNEFGMVSDEEVQRMQDKNPHSIFIENDKRGERIGVWIKWTQIENFSETGRPSVSDGRVYTLDLELGKVTFGDGKLGRIPHSDLPEYIRVDYALGGGLSGNLSPGKINKAVTSIPFLERVYNGSPIWGGLGTEHTAVAQQRISEHIRHRGMALTSRDIEAIIRSHNRDIHDVKATGTKGQVKISILPDAFPYQVSHFFEIKEKTAQILSDSMSSMVTEQNRFQISEPLQVAFSVNMDVVVQSAGDYIKALSRWHEQLEQYFHPLSGGPKRRGWKIGQLPEHASILADLKHMLEGSELIDNVMIQMHLVSGKKRIPIHHRASGQVDFKHAIPVNGQHDVRIRISDY